MADWTEKYIRNKQRFTARLKRRRERERIGNGPPLPKEIFARVFFSHPQRDPRPVGGFDDL